MSFLSIRRSPRCRRLLLAMTDTLLGTIFLLSLLYYYRTKTGISGKVMFQKSDYFILSAVVVSLALSVYLWIKGEHQSAIFVALWVPSILGIGIYLEMKSIKKGN